MDKLVHVMAVFGTRPEAIKMAPVIKCLQQDARFRVTCVVTAQHREMLDQVLDLFKLKPEYDLNVMQANQTLAGLTSRVLEGLNGVLDKCRPDFLLSQGDTTTAFVAGLAAFYHQVSVGHIEAGLRTDNIYDPFPEEMNRRLLTRIAELQFAPTVRAQENLLKEGINPASIYLTGNTVTDALRLICQELPEGFADNVKLDSDKRVLLVETHRRENLGAPMAAICRALLRIVQDFKDVQLVFSVHRNPKVREVVMPALQGRERIHLLEPVSYPELLRFMRGSYLIMTDSGGIQEEAPSLGVPALVLRNTTERPEGIESGNALLVGTNEEAIYKQAASLLSDKQRYSQMSQAASPYGDGHASERIAQAILHHLGRCAEKPAPFNPAS